MRWARSDLGTKSLWREVAAPRCGLDYDGTWGSDRSPCAELLKVGYTEYDHRIGKPLPFLNVRMHFTRHYLTKLRT